MNEKQQQSTHTHTACFVCFLPSTHTAHTAQTKGTDTSGCGEWCGTTTTLVLGFDCVVFVACCPPTPFLTHSHPPSSPHHSRDIGVKNQHHTISKKWHSRCLVSASNSCQCALIASMCPCCTDLQHCDTHTVLRLVLHQGNYVVGVLHLLFWVFVKTLLGASFVLLFSFIVEVLCLHAIHPATHHCIQATCITTFEWQARGSKKQRETGMVDLRKRDFLPKHEPVTSDSHQ